MNLNINWYPGHMKKSIDEIKNMLKLSDIVVEICDARIPVSSRNPILKNIIEDKSSILILNKKDLANPKETKKWIEKYKSEDIFAMDIDCKNTSDISKVLKEIDKKGRVQLDKKGLKRDVKAMIVGIPNVGKSSFINALTKKRTAKVGNRPGITRTNQWIKTEYGLYLLDTPGVLWPKFEMENMGLNLAFTGAIKDEIMNIENLAYKFVEFMSKYYMDNLCERYNLTEKFDEIIQVIEQIAVNRGKVLKGNRIDYFSVSNLILDDFRKGNLGKITLEMVGK